MTHKFDYDLDAVIAFMQQRLPGFARCDGMRVIGLRRNGVLVAGVAFEGINRHSAWMHVAAEAGSRWMTKDYLRACFAYPFEVCGVQRVSGYVAASNTLARRFDEHLGFELEATLRGAANDGGDVLLYVMWRDKCRWIARKEKAC